MAAAEMAFAGGLGIDLYLVNVPTDMDEPSDDALLFSESTSRFIVEVAPEDCDAFEAALTGVPHRAAGRVVEEPRLKARGLRGQTLIDEHIEDLKAAWKKPLDW